MKIMIAVHTYYPEHNGVQQVTQYMAEGLAKNHEVLVLSNWYEGMQRAEVHQNVSIERVQAKRNLFHVFCGEKKVYIDRIRSYQPDVLISVCTQSWPFDWVVRELDKLDCVKILYTHGYSECHKHYGTLDHLIHGRFGKAFNSVINRTYYSRAYRYIAKYDLVTYLSEVDIGVWYANKHRLTNGKILGNAVEGRFFEPFSLQDKKSEKDGIIRFLYVANYSDKKGQEMVLRAYYEAECEQAELIFCGQVKNAYCEQMLSLKQQLDAEKGKKKVTFLYEKSREDILALYRTSDVFVCGSLIEAFSISLCEAAASGLAAISTDVGNAATIPEVLIVHSQQEMAQEMTYLYTDEAERKRRGKALKAYADANCKISDKVTWMEQEIERLCKERETKVY